MGSLSTLIMRLVGTLHGQFSPNKERTSIGDPTGRVKHDIAARCGSAPEPLAARWTCQFSPQFPIQSGLDRAKPHAELVCGRGEAPVRIARGFAVTISFRRRFRQRSRRTPVISSQSGRESSFLPAATRSRECCEVKGFQTTRVFGLVQCFLGLLEIPSRGHRHADDVATQGN